MLSKFIGSSILVATLFMPIASQADAPPYVNKGTPLEELSINYDLTANLDAGTLKDPRIFLNVTDESDWSAPFVIATPKQGVCAKGAMTLGHIIEESQIEEVISNFIEFDLPELESEAGIFHHAVGRDKHAPSSEALAQEIASRDHAEISSNGGPGFDQYTRIDFRYSDGALYFSYLAAFNNFADCLEEFPRYRQE